MPEKEPGAGRRARDERERHLLELVGRIPREESRAAWCLFVEGYDIRTISEIMDRNENTVKSDLRRARQALEEILGGEDG